MFERSGAKKKKKERHTAFSSAAFSELFTSCLAKQTNKQKRRNGETWQQKQNDSKGDEPQREWAPDRDKEELKKS